MTTLHYAFQTRLSAIDREIGKLKLACNLTGSDESIFDTLKESLHYASPDPHGRACQALKGLFFLKTFVRYEQLESAGALPAGLPHSRHWT